MKTIDLSGEWLCTSPNGSISRRVVLPGSSCENEIGRKAEYADAYSKAAVRAPLEKYEYIGQLFYERDIEIPSDWDNLNVSLFFERINIASRLWIDDIEIGSGFIELTTPHIYRLTGRHNAEGRPLLTHVAGKHHIRLMIDNSDLLHIGDMASGYSVDTQGYWNGCIGRMEIQGFPKCYIERIDVFPEAAGIKVKTVLRTCMHTPMVIEQGRLSYSVTGPDGSECRLGASDKSVELFASRQADWFFIPMNASDIRLWDEFDRNLYTVKVTLDCETAHDEASTAFGFRTITAENRRFVLNGRTLSLRGTINCAQYPLTGYPPMDIETWEKHFKIYKEHGLNHVRFHAWCPPEAAFTAADRLGIYLAVEMPLWLNWDLTRMEFSDDDRHEQYYRTEALRISEFYGNHPSFCFFSNGNEIMGDFYMLETIIAETKAIDSRRVYTMTSNFDHPQSPYEDYLCAFEIRHQSARIQFLHDEVAKATDVNYDAMAAAVPVPFTSFEVGQYCVYPNVDLCEKYTGNMLPVNFDIIRKMMREHGVYTKLHDYIAASGDLAAKLYKEDIEAVLRTRGMGGFQLLSLCDYTGQSTATVGILDIFHESKGVISPEKWREFCSDVVPLFQANRIYSNTDTLEAELTLYDHGRTPIANPVYELELECDGKVLRHHEIPGDADAEDHPTTVRIPLDFVNADSLLNVTVTVNGYKNSWRIFVFTDDNDCQNADVIVNTPEELALAIREGRNVIATKGALSETQYKNSFVPVFWSPVHFPSTDPCGAFINSSHEALKSFPTDRYIDYQWKDLLDSSVSFDISMRDKADVIMEMVPNFVDNIPKSPLFIERHENSSVIYCGFDLTKDDLPTKSLKNSLIAYVKGL